MPFPSKHPGHTVFLLISGLLASQALAGDPATGPAQTSAITSIEDLRRLCPQELEQLFTRANVGPQPVGFVRGEILHLTNTRLPDFKAKMAGKVWKGKQFSESGEFVNQWRHFQAIRSHVKYGLSNLDGRPCMILEYNEKIPFFGNMRDDVREVGPGIYLSLVYDRSRCPKLRGIIGLEMTCYGGGCEK